jgi:8-oxo-dGTP pyrophosphatase MutT (NUDIX family)
VRKKALVCLVWRRDAASTDKKVLLLKLIPARGAYWQPVTGSIEEGESSAEGALREAEEETGLSFERHPQFMGLEYSFQDKWGMSKEQAFLLPIFGGEAPPAVKIDPTEHSAFKWVSPEEALTLVKWDTNKKALERATQNLPPLFLSKGGRFFQEGEEITHERTVELLHRSLVQTGSTFIARIGAEEIDVVVEDLPRFVKSYDRESGTLTLSDDTKEKLKPATLQVRADHSFACELESGLKALFLSSAYYEIAKDVREGSRPGEYLLHFLGSDQLLSIAP